MERKKIIINGRFYIHRVTGVERYARELILELDKIIKPGVAEIVLPRDVNELPQLNNITVKKIGRLHNRLWEHISLPLYALKKGIILNLCNVAPIISPGIVCIHDVKVKARPKDFKKSFLLWYRFLFFNECKRAKKIITVSEFSKAEICKYYKVNPDKIVVIPNAWQHITRIGYDENALEKYQLKSKEFFFSMCSLEPNKNFKWIAEAAKLNKDKEFAVAGSINQTVFSQGLGFECPPNMHLLGYVSDQEAKTLMRECCAFLFPTFYEGFGIPPLEAMGAGATSVYVSDTSIMHEVYKDSVEYIDPLDYKCNLDINESKEQSINNVLNNYSWDKSAKLLMDLIEQN